MSSFESSAYSLSYYKGDPLGIHDPSEAELGGVGGDQDGRFVKRSRKIVRGFFLMLIIGLCWVTTIHVLRLSFHTDRVLLAISPTAGNYSGGGPLGTIKRNVRQLPVNETIPAPGLAVTQQSTFQVTTKRVSRSLPKVSWLPFF